MIRVMIADDSAFMRMVLKKLFSGADDFEVVGVAHDGQEAVEKVKKLHPDLLTMDVSMPRLNGLEALEIIMRDNPVPVVMFSALTQDGTAATIKALEIGAVDFISKTSGPISTIDGIQDKILRKCRMAASANVRPRDSKLSNEKKKKKETGHTIENYKETQGRISRQLPMAGKPANKLKQSQSARERLVMPTAKEVLKRDREKLPQVRQGLKPVFVKRSAPKQNDDGVISIESCPQGASKLVAIGTSTGGPKALQAVITRLPGNLPCGVVVVQHMPKGFTRSLAERLDSISEISVKEAENHDVIQPGHVYIAPGDYHMTVQPVGDHKEIILNQDPPLGSHRPAVNVLFDSVVQFGKNVVSVIMTGMGCDGAEGMKKIDAAGGYIIAEDEESSVVYGMPKAVVDMGIADEVIPLSDIARAIVDAVKR